MSQLSWSRVLRKLFPAQKSRFPLHRRPRLGAETLEDRVTPVGRLFAAGAPLAGGGSLIYELNPADGAILNSFPPPEAVGMGAVGLAFDGTSLFYLNGLGSDTLYQLNPANGTIVDSDVITAGSREYDGLAIMGGKVVIQDYTANQFLFFDPVTDAITQTVTPSATTFAPDLQGGVAGAAGPDGLIAPISGGSLIAEFNPITGALVNSFNPGLAAPYLGAAVVDNEIYLGSGNSNTIRKYSRAGAFISQFTLPVPVAALGGDDTGTPPMGGVNFVNGGFETGTTSGWTVFNAPGSSTPGFTTYTGPNPQQSSLPAPPEGNFAAYNGHSSVGSYIMYQDIALPAGQSNAISLTAFYQNQYSAFVTPETIDHRVAANQQFRIDIITPTGDLYATTPDVVKLNVFRTQVGDALSRGAFNVTGDLSAFAGQTVRLRVSVTNNQFFLFGGVDNVRLTPSGPAATGSVQGVKFNDFDADGVRDAGEPGLPGWTIYADVNLNGMPDAGEPSTTTGADGSYTLAVPAGTHRIRELNQGGWAQTAPFALPLYSSADNGTTLITIDPVTGVATRVGAIGSFGAPDVRAGAYASDGTYWTIIYSNSSSQARLAKADLTTGVATPVGGVLWTGSPIYALEAIQNGFLLGISYSGQLVRIDTATGTPTVLGSAPPGVTDIAFDAARNLLWGVNPNSSQLIRIDPSTGLQQSGVTITGVQGAALGLMYHPLTRTLYLTSSLDILYTLDSRTGQAVQVGTGLGVPGVGGGDFGMVNWHTVTVATGQTVTGKNFGDVPDVGTVQGVKYDDRDGDGVRDAGEPGLPGWTIYADTNRNGRLDAGETTTVTAADGSYSLSGIPSGAYDIREVAKPGWVQTGPTAGRLFAARARSGQAPIITEYDADGLMVNQFTGPGVTPTSGPQGLADGGNSLFYVDDSVGPASRLLYELDPSTGAVRDSDPLPFAPGATGVAYLNGLVYFLTSSNQIIGFDPTTDTVVKTLQISGPSFFGGLTGAGDLGLLFATSSSVIYGINPDTGAIVRTLNPSVGSLSGGLAYRSGELIAAPHTTSGSTPLFRINPQTGMVMGVLTAIADPVGGLGGDGPVPGPHSITLNPGQTLSGRNFGGWREEGTINGVKFNDLNGNGVRNAGEPALAGWTIYADANNNGALDAGERSAVTAGDGSYSLTLPTGGNTIREVPQAGWAQTSPTSGRLFAFRGGSGTATISELDANGIVLNSFAAPPLAGSAGSQGLADGGSSLFYIDGSAGPPMLYELDPFTGAVRDADPFFPGGVSGLGYLNGLVYVTVGGNQIAVVDPAVDAIVKMLSIPGASIVGGLTGAGDLGLLFGTNSNGQIIGIDPETGAVVRTMNPGVGSLSGGLAYRPGELLAVPFGSTGQTIPVYRIHPQTGAVMGTFSTTGTVTGLGGDGPAPGPYRLQVTAGSVFNGRDFGGWRDEGTVSGVKFNDLNGDGIRNGGEPALAGWTIYADANNNGALDAGERSAVTAADGSYSLTLPSGMNTVREVPQAGWVQTSPTSGRLFALRATSGAASTISQLDSNGAVLNSFAGPAVVGVAGPQGLADGGKSLFYIDDSVGGNRQLYELDPFTGAVLDADPLLAPGGANGLGYLNGLVYVLTGGNQITVFDPVADVVTKTLTISGTQLIGALTGAGGLGLLFANNLNNQIVGINPETGDVVRTLSPNVGSLSGGLAYRSGELLASPFGGAGQAIPIYRIDPATGAVLGTLITVGSAGALGGDGPTPGPYRFRVNPGTAYNGRDFGGREHVEFVAANDSSQAGEDDVLTVAAPGVLANDSESHPGGTRSITAVNGIPGAAGQTVFLPSGSSVRLNADGGYAFTPSPAFNSLRAGQSATDSFPYTISDGAGGSSTATVTVTILGANDAPAAVADAFDTGENSTVSGNVLANDTDPDTGGPRSVVAVLGDPALVGMTFALPSGAVLTVGSDGAFVYDPDGAWNHLPTGQTATDQFTYALSDGSAAPVTATVVITITGANDSPVAAIDNATTDEDTAVTIAVLANDTDPDGDEPEITSFEQGEHGTVALSPLGLVYTPAANYHGTDSFEYTISDGNGGTASATVHVTVNPVNDAPAAVADSATTTEDGGAVAIDVRANDNDLENDTLTVTAVTQGAAGTVAIAGTGVTYTPVLNFVGTDSFTYTITDGHGGTSSATVTVNVTPVNDAPTLAPIGGRTVPEDSGPHTVNLTGITAGPANESGQSVSLSAVSDLPGVVPNPTISGYDPQTGTALLTFAPVANASGTATITVTVTDNGGGTNTFTRAFAVTVTSANDAPVAANDTATTAEDTPVTVPVLGNDTDLDNDALTVSAVTQAAHGTVTFTASGVTYAPAANYNGPDSFTYTVTDGHGGSATATVNVTVTPVNDDPTLNAIPARLIDEDAGVQTVSLTGITAGAGESQPLTVTASSSNPGLIPHPTVSYNSPAASGMLTFAPAANASGSAVITVTVSDGQWTAVRQFTVTVFAVNDAPTLDAPAALSVPEDGGAQTVTLTGITAGSGESQTLTVTASSSNPGLIPNPGVSYSSPNSTAALTFAPVANKSGTANITITVSDGQSTVQKVLAVTVTPVNDSPSFTAGGSQTVNAGIGLKTVPGWATNISRGPADEAGQGLTFLVTTNNPALFVSPPEIDPATGTLSFIPESSATGSAAVTAILVDDGGTADGGDDTSVLRVFNITVTSNGLPTASGIRMVGTELVITGGSTADTVTVSPQGNKVNAQGTVNGLGFNQSFSGVTRVRVDTKGGNDKITFASNLTVPTWTDAGAGNDTVTGSGGADAIYLGAGTDEADGGAGNDLLAGGAGEDLIQGGAGNDSIYAGDGDDFVIGGAGIDLLSGQGLNDIIVGGSAAVKNTSNDSLRKVLTDWNPSSTGLGGHANLRSRLTITNDGSNDRLTGGTGTDWFWEPLAASIDDLEPGEQRN